MCENSRYTPALVRALASGTRTVSTLTLRFLDLVLQGLFPRPYPGVARHLQRLLVVALALPPFACLQLLHWIGFALDEILFRGYRDIEIRQPTFVLGVPRSGTTFLHRLLAHDPQFTTFSTWECFFAPSISERYVCLELTKDVMVSVMPPKSEQQALESSIGTARTHYWASIIGRTSCPVGGKYLPPSVTL